MARHQLQTLLKLAQVTEDTAAKEFSVAQAAYSTDQHKLNELRTFRDDYESDHSSKPIRAGAFQSARHFLTQLCRVIEQQENMVALKFEHMNQEKKSWIDKQVKRRSVEKLTEKRTQQLELERDRREQKELDEMASRKSGIRPRRI